MSYPMRSALIRAAAFVAMYGVSAAMAASAYRVDPVLRTKDLVPVTPIAVNEKGDSAGYASDLSEHEQCGYRVMGGKVMKLTGSGGALIVGMNRKGDVVGTVDDLVNGLKAGMRHVVVWHADGTREDLGELGAPSGINAAGQVVGTRSTPDQKAEAFVYDHGRLTVLTGYDGESTYAEAINDAGWVVGGASIGQTTHAAMWKDGVFYDLGTLGGDNGWAYGINARGHVIGQADDTEGRNRGFFYDGVGMLTLQTAGGRDLLPEGINARDVVVGHDRSGVGLVWANGETRKVSHLMDGSVDDWGGLSSPSAISDAGHLVGYGTYGKQGRLRAYIATPLIR
ncbi:hypothetical protein AACH06_26825 [Ideonella sp. DXS29W]|uniref:HAF repeat-containing protein n=1 Tax=Ideonella lacteola TaxID=2984193 RepID=A0ABU9BXH6_9BURK